jgi:hypothetical protein
MPIEYQSRITDAHFDEQDDVSKVGFYLTIFVVWLVSHVFLFSYFGIRNFGDSVGYLREVDGLLEGRFVGNFGYVFYSIPIICMTFFRWLAPNQMIFFLFFQSILSGVAALALFQAATKIYNRPEAGLSAALIFLVWVDNIHWNTAVMTESIFCSLICFIIFEIAYFKGSIKNHFTLLLLTVMIVFTRPTGILIVVAVIAYFLKYHWHKLEERSVLKISILTALLISVYFGAEFMLTYWNFTDQYQKGNIVTYADSIKGASPLYSSSLQVDASNFKVVGWDEFPVIRMLFTIFYNPLFFIKSGCLKVWYLITATRPYYSQLHNIFTAIWMVSIYILFYVGWRNTKLVPIKIFVIVVIMANCALIAFSSVDWDNRFYIPMEPGIVLLAGGGAGALVGKIFDKVTHWKSAFFLSKV